MPQKVLTAAQMREIDRRTIEAGIPSLVLMENAGHRVVEFLERRFAPLSAQRIVVYCGKGNNGGDGLVVARQLFTRCRPAALWVMLTVPPGELQGDALANYRMLLACGGAVHNSVTTPMRGATLVVDAVLGTGVSGPAKGPALAAIKEINSGFPSARVVAVDMPSGLPSDTSQPTGEFVRADATVTFTALKVSQVLGPACYSMGDLHVAPIGSEAVLSADDSSQLSQIDPATFRHLLAPRRRDSNKGNYGHVLAVAGSRGKSGAAAMTGLAALRAGAGLVTVATPDDALDAVASHAPEIMTVALPADLQPLLASRNVAAIGPGIGTAPAAAPLVRDMFRTCPLPLVVDADALNLLAAESEWPHPAALRVLTPHPGEMARLLHKTVAEVQQNRVECARAFAIERGVLLVLKGDRTLLAFPDGQVWVNPTGSPAMSTGGTGDILTGLIAGFLAQFPNDAQAAVAAAVYLHGLAGEHAARQLGEMPVIATDLLRFLPDALHDCRHAL